MAANTFVHQSDNPPQAIQTSGTNADHEEPIPEVAAFLQQPLAEIFTIIQCLSDLESKVHDCKTEISILLQTPPLRKQLFAILRQTTGKLALRPEEITLYASSQPSSLPPAAEVFFTGLLNWRVDNWVEGEYLTARE